MDVPALPHRLVGLLPFRPLNPRGEKPHEKFLLEFPA